MSYQPDSIDISQLKAYALGLDSCYNVSIAPSEFTSVHMQVMFDAMILAGTRAALRGPRLRFWKAKLPIDEMERSLRPIQHPAYR